MGKPTGFKEFQRQTPNELDPRLRILNWNEFHEHTPLETEVEMICRLSAAANRPATFIPQPSTIHYQPTLHG